MPVDIDYSNLPKFPQKLPESSYRFENGQDGRGMSLLSR